MIKGKTKNGFEYQIDENIIRNIEVLDCLSELDDNNLIALPKLLKLMFSKEDKKRLYTACGNDTETVLKTTMEIFENNGEAKNS